MADYQQSARALRQVVIQEWVTLQQQTVIRSGIDPEVEANVLLALVNGGLSLDHLIQSQRLSTAQQEAALDRHGNGLQPQ